MKKAWSLLCAVLLAGNLTAALPTASVDSTDGTDDAQADLLLLSMNLLKHIFQKLLLPTTLMCMITL